MASTPLTRVRERLERAARAAQRDPSEVQLLAVTKSVELEPILALWREGQRDFGENRAQSLLEKVRALDAALAGSSERPRWHFIGHLQRNKAQAVLPHLWALHSVDRLSLLDHLLAEGQRRGAGQPLVLFLQVKLRAEAQKGGLAPTDVPVALSALAGQPGLSVAGLMVLAPWLEPEAKRREEAARVFAELAALGRGLRQIPWPAGGPKLSMGMSGDWEEAVAAGAHWVRLGSALFPKEATQ